jgi:N-glycosylase/DNA lyase
MMSVTFINQTIRAMCEEVNVQKSPLLDWRLLAEEELLYESAVCIFGSQLVFEMAIAMADRLRETGLLRPEFFRQERSDFEFRVSKAFNDPLALSDNNGSVRWVLPRFKNRLASLLTNTLDEIYGNSLSIRGLLFNAQNAKAARKVLIRHIWGFGPKQASLFLRRIGYCADLAVLDVHVLDYLKLAKGIFITPRKLGLLTFYEEIEDNFREIASEFGHSLGCVDLATWVTMRVAKREGYI